MKHKELANAIDSLKSSRALSPRESELVLDYIKELEKDVDDEFGPFDEGAWYVYKPS